MKIHILLANEEFQRYFPSRNHVALTFSTWPNWEPNWSMSSNPIKPSESPLHTSSTSSSFPGNELRLSGGSVRKPSSISTPCCRVFRLALRLLYGTMLLTNNTGVWMSALEKWDLLLWWWCCCAVSRERDSHGGNRKLDIGALDGEGLEN